jgi:tetratricopeptide (TPR) repeat protein
MRHRGPEALSDLENALRRDPDREVALAAAATLAWNLGRADESLAHWRRLVVLNPWLPTYRRSLTQLLLHRRNWVGARAQCRAWRRLDPASAEARQVWIELLHEGKKDEARQELTLLEALIPSERARLRTWFEQRTR